MPAFNFDLIVIGGGPGGYAAAIRAGQLKKSVLCIEQENLGGTCLNWGCIPSKSLLDDGELVRKFRDEAADHGITYDNLRLDLPKMVGRSRAIANRLKNGIAHLFRKYEVKYEIAKGQLLAPHQVRYTSKDGSKELTADHIILATGAVPTPLPDAPFDGQKIITSRQAMTLPKQPSRLAIIGAGAIGCEFADFYNAIGTQVTLIELLPHILPIEDDDSALMLQRSFSRRGIKVLTSTRTESIEKTPDGVRLSVAGQESATIETDQVLVAIGVTANTDGLAAPDAHLDLDRKRVKVDLHYRTNLENVWAIGDCIGVQFPPEMGMGEYRHADLAHVAHHEAVICVERIFGISEDEIDYRFVPGCTYTHPQVASLGYTEKKLREQRRDLKIGRFPFTASGRALASGETEGFVKLIFDARYGALLGVHMIGENVTELLSEMVLARRLEATEAEIMHAMHPHPTLSEALMEAAGVAIGRAIHL